MFSVLNLTLIVPTGRTDAACALLADHPGVTNVIVMPGAARQPAGDVVHADVAREAAHEVLEELRGLDLERDGSITVRGIDLSLSAAADAAERHAPGHGDDAVIWHELDQRTADESLVTWSFLAFLVLATQLAAIAALIDSPILIVGAMVLGPEFGAVAAICFGLVFLDLPRILLALRTLVTGFAVAIVVTYVCMLLGRWTGVIELDRLPDSRPLTGFVYNPDRWSFIVALLAGAAGVLSMTAGKSAVLVGVFISVTTVPAAGNIAVGAALRHWSEVTGSTLQLAVNLGGMVIAGALTLIIQKVVWELVRKKGWRGRRATPAG